MRKFTSEGLYLHDDAGGKRGRAARPEVAPQGRVGGANQLKARDRWVEVETPAGRIPALLPLGLASGWAPRMDAVPALGQHTAAILEELGFEQTDISRFRSQHVV